MEVPALRSYSPPIPPQPPRSGLERSATVVLSQSQ